MLHLSDVDLKFGKCKPNENEVWRVAGQELTHHSTGQFVSGTEVGVSQASLTILQSSIISLTDQP